MADIIVCPVKQLYAIAADGYMAECAAIAVSSYPISADKLSGFGHLITMEFDDITDRQSPRAFTREKARAIAEFAKNLPESTDTVFVSCDCGESRSSAIAAAVMRHCGMDEMTLWRDPKYHPNGLVYALLCREMGLPLTKEDLAERIRTNQNALRDIIKRNREKK